MSAGTEFNGHWSCDVSTAVMSFTWNFESQTYW